MWSCGRRRRGPEPRGTWGAGAATAWLAVACGACGGGSVAKGGADAGPKPLVAVVPDGGVCAAGRAAALPPGSSPAPTDGAGPCADGGTASEFSPATPVGVGYPGDVAFLPDHVAYLTFDDGPSDWTAEFLDILASRGVTGTFFVTARQLKGAAGLDGTYLDAQGHMAVYRDLVRRELDEGHLVGNHTVNHPDLGTIGESQIQAELDENELLINTALLKAGGSPRILSLVRPPYGSPWFGGDEAEQANAGVAMSRHGVNVLWTIDSTDSAEWALGESYSRSQEPLRAPDPPTYDAKKQRVQSAVLGDPTIAQGKGAIILMHDTHDTTRDVLPAIIDGLVAAGYTFDSLEGYTRARWGRPSADLTPGPSLFQGCVAAGDWGCLAFDGGAGAPVDRSLEVCGRMWLAYQALGGPGALGAPTGAPSADGLSQPFEHGTIELHPENPAPCNVVLLPR